MLSHPGLFWGLLMFMKGQDKDVLKLDLFKNVASIAWLYMIGTGAVGKIPLGDAKLANWTIVPITVSFSLLLFSHLLFMSMAFAFPHDVAESDELDCVSHWYCFRCVH